MKVLVKSSRDVDTIIVELDSLVGTQSLVKGISSHNIPLWYMLFDSNSSEYVFNCASQEAVDDGNHPNYFYNKLSKKKSRRRIKKSSLANRVIYPLEILDNNTWEQNI